MIRRLAFILIAFAVAVTACGDDDSGAAATTPATAAAGAKPAGNEVSSAEYSAFRAQPVACDAPAPPAAIEMSFTEPEDLGLDGTVTAVLATSCGDVTIELDPGAAPATVNSFVFLAEQGYFNGSVSHRVVPGFMIQAGDPTATGRNGPGYQLPDELPDAGFVYTRGTVAMANAGPNTSGSQFFLMLADVGLPPAYSVFGTVVSGLDVLDRIATVPTVARRAGLEPSSPTETIYIEGVSIQR
jgi:cyclophilin family peptidyl-prolyl cis-trans isomerase